MTIITGRRRRKKKRGVDDVVEVLLERDEMEEVEKLGGNPVENDISKYPFHPSIPLVIQLMSNTIHTPPGNIWKQSTTSSSPLQRGKQNLSSSMLKRENVHGIPIPTPTKRVSEQPPRGQMKPSKRPPNQAYIINHHHHSQRRYPEDRCPNPVTKS